MIMEVISSNRFETNSKEDRTFVNNEPVRTETSDLEGGKPQTVNTKKITTGLTHKKKIIFGVGAVLLLATVLMGIYIPRAKRSRMQENDEPFSCDECMTNAEQMAYCLSKVGSDEDSMHFTILTLCPGTISLTQPLVINTANSGIAFPGRGMVRISCSEIAWNKTVSPCILETTFEQDVFISVINPADKQMANDTFVEFAQRLYVVFMDVTFISKPSRSELPGAFIAPNATLQFTRCSFVNSTTGFLFQAETSLFRYTYVANCGSPISDQNDSKLDSAMHVILGNMTKRQESPDHAVIFGDVLFEDNSCDTVVKVTVGPNIGVGSIRRSTFLNNNVSRLVAVDYFRNSSLIETSLNSLYYSMNVSDCIFEDNQANTLLDFQSGGGNSSMDKSPSVSLRDSCFLSNTIGESLVTYGHEPAVDSLNETVQYNYVENNALDNPDPDAEICNGVQYNTESDITMCEEMIRTSCVYAVSTDDWV